MAAKTYREFAASIIDTLEALGIMYAIGGSFASNAYGEARMTLDIDISIVLPQPEPTGHRVSAVRTSGRNW